MADSSAFLVNGKDYRQMSATEYAASVYEHIEANASRFELDEMQVAALKVTLFMESSGQYNARPPIRRYSEAEVKDSGVAPEQFEARQGKNGTYYVQVKWRLDEEDEVYKDYNRTSSAYSAFQVITSSREKFTDLLNPELPFSHPENQAVLGAALMQDDTKVLTKLLDEAGAQVSDPYEQMGAMVAYTNHFWGAPRAAKVLDALATNPQTPLREIIPAHALKANATTRLPSVIDPERKGFEQWTVGDFATWVESYKYAAYVDNVAKADSLLHPERSVAQSAALFQAALTGNKESPPTQVASLLQRATGSGVKEAFHNGQNELMLALAEKYKSFAGIDFKQELAGWSQDIHSVSVVSPRTDVADKFHVYVYDFSDNEVQTKEDALRCLLEKNEGVLVSFKDSHVTEGTIPDEAVIRLEHVFDEQSCIVGHVPDERTAEMPKRNARNTDVSGGETVQDGQAVSPTAPNTSLRPLARPAPKGLG